jgi:arabinogalactan endo-1,4-beta-galactosidase
LNFAIRDWTVVAIFLLDIIEMNLILYDNFNCCYIYIFKIEGSQDAYMSGQDISSSVANSGATTNCHDGHRRGC